jgi:hypothetical protein
MLKSRRDHPKRSHRRPRHHSVLATIDDPQVYSRPWTIRMPLQRQKDLLRLLEYQCRGEMEDANGDFESEPRTWYPGLSAPPRRGWCPADVPIGTLVTSTGGPGGAASRPPIPTRLPSPMDGGCSPGRRRARVHRGNVDTAGILRGLY